MPLAKFEHERHDAVWVRTEYIVSVLPVVDEVGVKIPGLALIDVTGRDNPLHVLGSPQDVADYVLRIDAGEQPPVPTSDRN